MTILETLAAIATIVTTIVAVVGYGSYRLDRWRSRRKIESLLAERRHQVTTL